MRKSKRPKRPRIPPVVVQPNAATLQFSFKHLDSTNPRFPLEACSAEFWMSLILEIHRYSQWTVDMFNDQNNDDHRHILVFEETSEPDGFAQLDTEQLAYLEAWQFAVGVQHWRVMGFILDNIFYVIWLDPHHALYGGFAPNSG